MFARLTLQFPSTYICICNRVRSVSFSDGGLRDRDIIFRDETALAFCFRHSRLTAGREGRVQILAIECLFFVLFCFFFFLPTVSAFFTIKRTHSHKQGKCEDTRKGRKETEGSSLHSISG